MFHREVPLIRFCVFQIILNRRNAGVGRESPGARKRIGKGQRRGSSRSRFEALCEQEGRITESQLTEADENRKKACIDSESGPYDGLPVTKRPIGKAYARLPVVPIGLNQSIGKSGLLRERDRIGVDQRLLRSGRELVARQ